MVCDALGMVASAAVRAIIARLGKWGRYSPPAWIGSLATAHCSADVEGWSMHCLTVSWS